ncbi:radical SAM domain/B12 binding domain-containing protein [Catenovulum agarivorans DS-2]|uniref:Radical SAM domain/B12 binding domain-containing protein n=1 Tax=Catenovulum agarivorans DS-2 TaxID=1328313 RepID=W7QJY0_9ALTE|nr:B12-binding domain-containing radical SAM protein [Catenovulum agarivorans]EWH08438.1 radical SAM domain/B12 binding domain-containing protein [Catenovulum agarivorans DS-2]
MTEQAADSAMAISQINLADSKQASSLAKANEPNQTKIILATINAKYIHASLGLRYLYANMQELQASCEIKEFVIQNRPIDIVEQILQSKPRIVGFGVYIWNIVETTNVVSLLKVIAPEVKVVLGGPEVSYETEQQAITQLADYVLTGAADLSFYRLCSDLLNDTPPEQKILKSKPVELSELQLPYQYYSDEDLKNRLLYVEASRGCPFKCEFCLSSLDTASNPFELDTFLEQMDILYQRGARNFKFIDRTFNLNINTSIKIMQFFLDRMTEDLYLHFEVVPDHLPRKLKEFLAQFPEDSLQFEVGIQTFEPQVQANISRKQNNNKSKDNLKWLRENTSAHIHADLIFGLPGETLESFRDSFNELYACNPQEIQLGILKRLKGSPIIRHTDSFDLRFSPLPPFNILSTDRVDFATMQLVNRFARYWDMLGNSGRFKFTLPQLLSGDPFDDFMMLTNWLYEKTGQTHQINLKRLFELLAQATEALFPARYATVLEALEQDYNASKLKSVFATLKLSAKEQPQTNNQPAQAKLLQRQQRHKAS